MKKRLISITILLIYSVVLIKIMVFKDLPIIRIGSLMLNFAGTDTGTLPNFIPFKTIVPYLFGHKGLIIAGINLVGNIILLVPVGFLLPFVFQNISWKKSLIIAIASGLVIEVMQVVLRVGIFDIDDVILNALGVMTGYFIALILIKWIHSRNYKNILIAASLSIVAAILFYIFIIYPISHQSVNPRNAIQNNDLCGGTGGIGEIVSMKNSTITIKRKDGRNQTVNFTDRTTVKTSTDNSSLKIGDKVTLVGDANSDGSFTADTILVCITADSENNLSQQYYY